MKVISQINFFVFLRHTRRQYNFTTPIHDYRPTKSAKNELTSTANQQKYTIRSLKTNTLNPNTKYTKCRDSSEYLSLKFEECMIRLRQRGRGMTRVIWCHHQWHYSDHDNCDQLVSSPDHIISGPPPLVSSLAHRTAAAHRPQPASLSRSLTPRSFYLHK